MNKIIDDVDEWGKSGVRDAKNIRDFFTDKKTLLYMVFILDLQGIFSAESLVMQHNDASFIGEYNMTTECRIITALDFFKKVIAGAELCC